MEWLSSMLQMTTTDDAKQEEDADVEEARPGDGQRSIKIRNYDSASNDVFA